MFKKGILIIFSALVNNEYFCWVSKLMRNNHQQDDDEYRGRDEYDRGERDRDDYDNYEEELYNFQQQELAHDHNEDVYHPLL